MRVSLGLMSSSIRHGRHLPDERVLEPEVAQVANPLWIEYAIQVVDFMLHDTRVKALDRAVDRRTGGIEPLVTQPPVTRHEAAHAGDRETSFPSLLLLGIERRQQRIDEHRVGHGGEL